MSKAKRVTITDIARLAGVSPGAVSFALNGRPGVSEQTRQRILDIAEEHPLLAAQRELTEEADLVAAHWEPLVSSWTTPGGNDELIQVFLATGLTAAAAAHAREDEEADIRLAWLPLEEAVAGVLAGRLRNGILALGVLATAQRLRDRS